MIIYKGKSFKIFDIIKNGQRLISPQNQLNDFDIIDKYLEIRYLNKINEIVPRPRRDHCIAFDYKKLQIFLFGG